LVTSLSSPSKTGFCIYSKLGAESNPKETHRRKRQWEKHSPVE